MICFTDFQQFKLEVANSWCTGASCTHTHFATKKLSTIDYIFHNSHDADVRSGVVNDVVPLESDHFLIWCIFLRNNVVHRRPIPRPRSLTGYRVNHCAFGDEHTHDEVRKQAARENFSELLMQFLGLQSAMDIVHGNKLSLSNLGTLCYDAALSYHGWTTKTTRRKPQMSKPKQLVDADNAAIAAPRGSLEKKLLGGRRIS